MKYFRFKKSSHISISITFNDSLFAVTETTNRVNMSITECAFLNLQMSNFLIINHSNIIIIMERYLTPRCNKQTLNCMLLPQGFVRKYEVYLRQVQFSINFDGLKLYYSRVRNSSHYSHVRYDCVFCWFINYVIALIGIYSALK